MPVQRPKNILQNFKNRNIATGKERRLNMEKSVLENQPHFPKTLNYEDIDLEVFKWLDNGFDITYDGKKLNTYKLFSNQRISEYGQTWKNLDEKGNLDINFKTITRESNPQKGEIQGGNYTIPGNITFPIFKVRDIDVNGVEYVANYSMRQPMSVNLIYTVGIFTNSYKLLNRMNTLVHNEFRSLEKYIFPNGFAIPMELNSTSDESEYTIDDRKYYSQTFQIKVMAFIITEDDYIVTKTPVRERTLFRSGVNSQNRSVRKEKFNIQQSLLYGGLDTNELPVCNDNLLLDKKEQNIDDTIKEMMEIPREAELEMEELCGKQVCWKDTEDEIYVNRKIVFKATVNYCNNTCEFESEYNLSVESLEIDNVKAYRFFINGVIINIENSDIEIHIGDIVRIEVDVYNEKHDAIVTIITYDTDEIIKKDVYNQPQLINVE